MSLIVFNLFCLLAVSTAQKRPTIEEFLSQPLPKESYELTGEALVAYVNQRQNFFQTEVSSLTTADHRARLMSEKYLTQPKLKSNEMLIRQFDGDIPENFDARERWNQCSSLRTIRDQSHCGSCWAVSAAETMSDRACIQSNGTIQVELSATDILSCCDESCGNGCDGGFPIEAWRYFMLYGVCTGGHYGKKDACKPYAFYPCGYHRNEIYYGQCPRETFPTPPCTRYCQTGYYNNYEDDKIYGKSAYAVENNERAIQVEIMTNGPVQAAFMVYEDFSRYKSGIYVHTAGKRQGGHAVKLVGWGVDADGNKYWLAANSWNSDWGEDGYFRIVRGVDHCGIESRVVAGMVDI